jgi:hypothetical protein
MNRILITMFLKYMRNYNGLRTGRTLLVCQFFYDDIIKDISNINKHASKFNVFLRGGYSKIEIDVLKSLRLAGDSDCFPKHWFLECVSPTIVFNKLIGMEGA